MKSEEPRSSREGIISRLRAWFRELFVSSKQEELESSEEEPDLEGAEAAYRRADERGAARARPTSASC